MNLPTRFALISIILFLASCGSNGNIVLAPTLFATVTISNNPTPTLTPFQPGEYVAPNATAEEEKAASEPIPQTVGQVTLVLLGSDQRPNQGYYLTDVIMLIILKPDGSVSLVSFPRDLRVFIPTIGMGKINSAMEYGGFDLFKSTMAFNFGITPQSFILTNFNGFKSIVDNLGGIDVSVSQALVAPRDGYPDDYTVDPGIVHMDGEMALWYVRSRSSTSDIDRLRRAQEVLLAISKRLFNLNALSRIPELYQAYRSSVVTDLTPEDVLQLLPLLRNLDANRIHRYAITFNEATGWIEPGSGRYYLLPDMVAIRQILLQAIGQ